MTDSEVIIGPLKNMKVKEGDVLQRVADGNRYRVRFDNLYPDMLVAAEEVEDYFVSKIFHTRNSEEQFLFIGANTMPEPTLSLPQAKDKKVSPVATAKKIMTGKYGCLNVLAVGDDGVQIFAEGVLDKDEIGTLISDLTEIWEAMK